MPIHIRAEEKGDETAVTTVNRLAFKRDAEADLVNAVRHAVEPVISLVAEVDGRVVGHILFTPVTVRDEQGQTWRALGLGPMAVLPTHQNQGIGSQLVRAGLAACREIGENVVFVLGHPDFYPRFGFQPAAPLGLQYKSPDYDPAFFVAELSTGALQKMNGNVAYSPQFEGI